LIGHISNISHRAISDINGNFSIFDGRVPSFSGFCIKWHQYHPIPEIRGLKILRELKSSEKRANLNVMKSMPPGHLVYNGERGLADKIRQYEVNLYIKKLQKAYSYFLSINYIIYFLVFMKMHF
jgi:hypothetical protein